MRRQGSPGFIPSLRCNTQQSKGRKEAFDDLQFGGLQPRPLRRLVTKSLLENNATKGCDRRISEGQGRSASWGLAKDDEEALAEPKLIERKGGKGNPYESRGRTGATKGLSSNLI